MLKIEVNKIATLQGHNDAVYALEPDPGQPYIYSSGADGMVVKWDLEHPENGQLVAKVDHSVYALCYSTFKNKLVVGNNHDGIHLIDIYGKKETGSLNLSKAAIFDIINVDNNLILGDGDGFLIKIDLESLTISQKIRLSNSRIRVLAYNPVQEEIAVGSSDHSIKIINSKKLKIKQDIQAHNNSVFALQYAPDYQYLLSGSRDAHLKVWNTAGGYRLKESIVAHMYAINDIAFRQDGKYFATCSMDKTIKIWDSESIKLLKIIDKGRHAGHGTSVNKLKWVSYKDQLLSASDDRTISIWEIYNLP